MGDKDKFICKNCQKPCEKFGRSGLYRHIKVSKKCNKSYTSKEIAEIQQISSQASKSKKSKYMKKYCSKNIAEKKKYNQKNYLKNKDLIRYQRRNRYEISKGDKQEQKESKGFCRFCKKSFGYTC